MMEVFIVAKELSLTQCFLTLESTLGYPLHCHLERRRYSQGYHKTLKEGVKRKKNQREFKNTKRWRLFHHQKKRYPKYNIWTSNLNEISGGGDQNYKAKHKYRTPSFFVSWDYNTIEGETNV
jgi:hypothetical protein